MSDRKPHTKITAHAWHAIASCLLALVMVTTGVLSNWPQESGLFDLWSRVDETIADDIIPETVEAVEQGWWPELKSCQYLKFSEFTGGYRTYNGHTGGNANEWDD